MAKLGHFGLCVLWLFLAFWSTLPGELSFTKCLPCSTCQGRKLDAGTCQLLWQLFECALLDGGCVAALVCTDTPNNQTHQGQSVWVRTLKRRKPNRHKDEENQHKTCLKLEHVMPPLWCSGWIWSDPPFPLQAYPTCWGGVSHCHSLVLGFGCRARATTKRTVTWKMRCFSLGKTLRGKQITSTDDATDDHDGDGAGGGGGSGGGGGRGLDGGFKPIWTWLDPSVDINGCLDPQDRRRRIWNIKNHVTMENDATRLLKKRQKSADHEVILAAAHLWKPWTWGWSCRSCFGTVAEIVYFMLARCCVFSSRHHNNSSISATRAVPSLGTNWSFAWHQREPGARWLQKIHSFVQRCVERCRTKMEIHVTRSDKQFSKKKKRWS